MPAERSAPRLPAPPGGLCETCTHQVIVRNTRGSVFSLCGLSRVDPAYPRYPRLPVLRCAGYAMAADDQSDPLDRSERRGESGGHEVSSDG